MEAEAWGIWSCYLFSQALEKGVAVAASFGFHSVLSARVGLPPSITQVTNSLTDVPRDF